MDPILEERDGNSSNKYTVEVNVQNNGNDVEVTATPTPYEPPPPNLDTTVDAFPNFLDRNAAQDAVGPKFSDSHFRPCLPNEGPLPSGCTPQPIWRPCLPPVALASGKLTRTLDKFGSTWASFTKPLTKNHDKEVCSFDREWVLQAAKAPNNCRAGKLSEVGGTLLFPGAHVVEQKVLRKPHGKNVGDILPRLRPRSGDVFILPCISSSSTSKSDPRGYVGFVNNSSGLKLEGGTLLLRIVKFRDSTLRTRKQMKLFLLTVDHSWRLKGMLDTYGYLEDPCVPSNYRNVPVRYRRAIKPNTSDLQCIPQRGDVIIREPWKDLFPHHKDKQASLRWWQPNLELDLNDILLRTCIWNCCNKFEGFVDLYYYNGKGLRWVFLGRDETIFQPTTLGLDSDTSDDEKLAPNLGPANPRPYANPLAGNWPLNEPLDASNLSNFDSILQ